METPLLQTKLYIPPIRPELVPRPRLIERLNEGLHRKLSLISAPAGFGKTTLIAEWGTRISESTIPQSAIRNPKLGWLSLDEGDNDPVRFLTYFIAALQTIEANIGKGALGVLQASQPQPPPPESILTSLINDIAKIPDHFALVLDDYHVIESQPIDQALTFLLDHLPPPPGGMHLIIASRTDPSLSLSRLRAGGQMTEIRTDDLRFRLDEVATFLDKVMGLNLSPEHVAALETRTEGWIAGLQLAALSMQGRDAERIADFINSFTGSHRYILDYLADEVLQRRPKGTKDFLLQTSILDRLSGPLCDAVIGSPPLVGEGLGEGSSQSILETLEAANLFIVPLDDERHWYRYHHLFADLLRNRLEASQPELVPELHRRASAWYASNNLRSEAIDHSLAAEDWERVAQLIDQIVNDVLGGSEYFTTVLGWLEALPKEVVRARPRLGAVRAWMLLLTLQHDAAELCLQEIESATDDQLPDEVRLQITTMRAFLARRQNDVGTAIKLSHQVLEALDKGASAPNLVRPMVTLNLANVYRMIGDVVEAQRWFSEVLAITQGAGLTLTLAATNGQASAQIIRGQLHQAAKTYRRGLQLADKAAQQSGQPAPAAAFLHPGLGDLLREWNKLDEAADHLAQGLELGRQWQIGMALCNGYVFGARLKQAQGDMAGALDMIRQAEQLPQTYQTAPRYSEPVAACRAHLMLAQAGSSAGDLGARHLEAVRQWVEARGLGADGLRMSAIRIDSLDDEFEHLVWARLLIAQDEPDRALQLLARLLQAAEEYGRTGRVIEILALQALAHQALGDAEQALVDIERALSLAEPEGYIRLFVDEGRPMAKLLRQAASRGITPDYIGKLLAVFQNDESGMMSDELNGTKIHPSSPAPVGVSPQPLVEPLSERELEVLCLIAAGLTNREIAETLVIALGTAKAHTASIYAKLDVRNRTQAVARARELNLL